MKRIKWISSIGVIIKDLNYPFYTTIASAIEQFAESKGYSVMITSSNNNYESEKKLLHMVYTKYVKGIIIAPVSDNVVEIGHLYELNKLNCPFVLLEDVKGIKANVVTVDHLDATRKAVKYLIDGGHKNIVHFAGAPGSSHATERINGFKYAFSESSFVLKKNMIVPIGSSYNDGYYKTLKYFHTISRKEYPTAIVCFNDNQALAVITALKELKIRIPEDISIIGNDDIYYAKDYSVPLTTIRIPQHEIGVAAAKIVIDNIKSPLLLQTKHLVLGTELIVRKSSKLLNC